MDPGRDGVLMIPNGTFTFLLVIFCLFLGSQSPEAQKLPAGEVVALRAIGDKLGKKWDFSVDACSGTRGWATANSVMAGIFSNNVTCACSIQNSTTTCHVTHVLLKGQNLTGVLPEEFANLTSLQEIDLTRNCLNGSIPAAWASLPLVSLSLLGNRISGMIPHELGRITTLESLVLEDNMLRGPLPSGLGNLINLQRLLLSGNIFSGTLPQTFGQLRNLTDFRIDGNCISGPLPEFIGNWTKLGRLDMQGTCMMGPIPSSISLLESLSELRLSDLDGSTNSFPPLENLMNIKQLVLRNCLISGEIPSYIRSMSQLKSLDLSFNNLTGEIPLTLGSSLDYMYLTDNKLTGVIPSWVFRSSSNLDISYNSFFASSSPTTCSQGNLNYIASYSTTEGNSILSCLKKGLPCSAKARNYQLFINCGGGELSVDGLRYEGDPEQRGPATFYSSPRNTWSYSSTGDYVGNSDAVYTTTNVSRITSADFPVLYMTARLAPISLKYYGLCLQAGNYTVGLHFAEIMFTDDQTFSSNGRRIFDVSIQGKIVLKDFNVGDVAGGRNKGLVLNFTTLVTPPTHTLEIHLYWAGKGTNAIPQRGVYGPLISAITVTPNFKPDLGDDKLSHASIIAISAGSCVSVALVFFILWKKGCFGRKNMMDKELQALESMTGYFSFKQIKAATHNFDPENKIGEGGFGPVYKGILHDGTVIAVKQLSSKSRQGNREFVNEVGMISALQHPNLVKLYGCCIEGNQLLLVYEYMENNSLARALFGHEKHRLNLDWSTRRKICLGIAKGLAYLHEESRLKIVHRDIKATNILLDKKLNAKISDFGLAKLNEEENTHISTRVAGTIGYMAPEYAMRGYLTDKADVYSFGVVVLEIVSGKSNTNYKPKEEFIYLLDWAYVLHEKGSLLELVDPSLGLCYKKEEALQMLNLALLCTNPSPTLRPTMSTVVGMFEGQAAFKAPGMNVSWNDSSEILSYDCQSQTMSMNGPWISSSKSVSSQEETETVITVV